MTYFVSGSVKGQLQDNGVTVQSKGDTTTLYYARPDSIVGTGPMRDVALTVQVRHKAGVQVPEVTVDTVQNNSNISEALLRWLE